MERQAAYSREYRGREIMAKVEISVYVSYHGTEEALKQFEQALAARKRGAVKRVLKHYDWNTKAHFFGENNYEECEIPYGHFKPLMRLFPDITFVFDVYFEDRVYDVQGDVIGFGRYFTVYEAGKRVYDAGKRVEWPSVVDAWCDTFGRPKDKDLDIVEGWDLFHPLCDAARMAMDGKHGSFTLGKDPVEMKAAAKKQEEAGTLHGYRDYLNKKAAGALPCFHRINA
ncbi:hypothetical protein AGMMS49944_24980 [Spirochaetia bacterium]|nr:hypothetical protein AGMMS49944_24980 [Spirochaetia bacterium]